MYQSLIKLYPLIFPRLYVWLRLKIFPLKLVDCLIPKTGTVLDVGCGYGFSSIYFAQQSSDRKVKGIELDSGRIKMAQAAALNIQNVTFETDNLACLQTDRYRTIVLIDLLHHLSAQEKSEVLHQCHQLLDSRGQLIIKDINTTPRYKYWWNYFHDQVVTHFGRLEFFDYKQMKNLLTRSGFEIKDHYPISNILYPHYLYVCKKS